jgi:protein-S-isoprenylcysteine O-methyltransferase Ste14
VAIQTAIAIVVLAAAPLSGIALASLAQTSSSIAGVALMAGGVFMFGWGTVVLGPSFSVWLKPRDDARLVVEGPYSIVRHPICTAQAIIGFGWALWWASPIALALAVVYAAYLDRFKLRREEQLLLRRYPAYALYRRQVPHRMLPVPGSAAVPSGPPAGGPSGGR